MLGLEQEFAKHWEAEPSLACYSSICKKITDKESLFGDSLSDASIRVTKAQPCSNELSLSVCEDNWQSFRSCGGPYLPHQVISADSVGV